MDWYEEEVRSLEAGSMRKAKGTRPPVFYGSSSIRQWDTLAKDVTGAPPVLNLGFGGSTLEACNYFFERLVAPVHPRSLLLYAGDNDLGDGRSVEQVLSWFRSLAAKAAKSLSGGPFGFMSVKPSPARASILDRIRCVNELVRGEMERCSQGYFVDVYSAMVDKAGKPRNELFSADGLVGALRHSMRAAISGCFAWMAWTRRV